MIKVNRENGVLTGLIRANKVFIVELYRSGKFFLIFQLITCALLIPVNYWITYSPKYFIDSIIEDKNLHTALLWIFLTIILKYFDRILLFFQEFFKRHALSEAKLRSKEDLYRKIQLIHLTYFEDPKNLDIFNKALSYNENGGERFINSLIGVLRAVIMIGTMTYISFQFSWWIWIAILLVVLIDYFTDKHLKKLGFSFSMEKIKRDRKQNYYNGLPTNKGSIADIKLNSSMDFFFKKYEEAFVNNREFSEKYDKKINCLSLLFSIPGEILFFICYVVIGVWLLDGRVTLGDYTLFFAMITSITSQLKVIIASINSLYEQSLSARVYNGFINDEEAFPAVNNTLIKINGIDELRFNNVTFSYPGRVEKALDNISLTIKRGEKISIVGFNGAGKTTFIKLLTLLYSPNQGKITINGYDHEGINPYCFWNNIGIVFQDHQEYAMTIKDNILLRDSSSVDDALVWKVLDDVGLSRKIHADPNGINLQLTKNFDPNGMDFSGGERQKLSIAKVLAKESDLYIFDEPSSALDPIAEDILYRRIAQIPDDKTVLMISHRLSSVLYTDRILFFDNGRIVADGTHESLMKTCEKYREIYNIQAEKYMR